MQTSVQLKGQTLTMGCCTQHIFLELASLKHYKCSPHSSMVLVVFYGLFAFELRLDKSELCFCKGLVQVLLGCELFGKKAFLQKAACALSTVRA